jgi:hypothetical protein
VHGLTPHALSGIQHIFADLAARNSEIVVLITLLTKSAVKITIQAMEL